MDTLIIKDITSALSCASIYHADQRRKGERKEPYINHIIEVLELLSLLEYKEYFRDLLIAGILHDILEDTKMTKMSIRHLFGKNVLSIVEEVTDDKNLSRTERKQHQIDSSKTKTDPAKLIKLADKISNIKSLIKSEPVGWEYSEKIEYIEWSKKVAEQCFGVDSVLDSMFMDTYDTAKSHLGY